MDPFCQGILRKHWSSVPIVEDVRDVKQIMAHATQVMSYRGGARGEKRWKKSTDYYQGNYGGSKGVIAGATTSGQAGMSRIVPDVDLLTGGFPCQGFSVAGKQRGKEDDRYLWPPMFEVIKAVRPHYVIAENVAGIINLALDTVLSDLESEGYACQAFVIPACAQSAPHRRDRVWIVANTAESSKGWRGIQRHGENQSQVASRASSGIIRTSQDVANTPDRQDDRREGRDLAETEGQGGCIDPAADIGREDVADTTSQYDDRCRHGTSEICGEQSGQAKISGSRERKFESGLGVQNDGLPGWLVRAWGTGEWEEGISRVATGVKDRVNKLKALGNAIVPQVVVPIMQAIKEIEYEECHTWTP